MKRTVLFFFFTSSLLSCFSHKLQGIDLPLDERLEYGETSFWRLAGITHDGMVVYIDTSSILYSKKMIRVWAKTQVNKRAFIDRLEFDYPHYKFRILKQYSAGKSRWRGVTPVI